MPQQSAADIFFRFERQTSSLENLARQATVLRKQAKLSILSADSLYNSALLSLHLRFELFLEDLFYSCITDTSGISDSEPEVIFSTRQQAESIFFGHLPFPVWMPYSKGAEKVAKRAFKDGGPFSRLSRQPDEKKFLTELTDMRNAVAHQSKSALSKVEHLTSPMRARSRHPAGYLQSTSQGVTRYSEYISSILVIARALSEPDLASAKRILSPESPYKHNDEAGRGRYSCVVCGHSKSVRTVDGKIGHCTKCRRLLQSTSNSRQPTGNWRRVY